MIETSVAETIAERVEQEFARVRAARPSLASRIERAENIVVTHLSCRRQRVIRVRVREGRARFLVNGSGASGAVYVVNPSDWSCSCPDHHRHGKGCKHALACWALWRASARPALPGDRDGMEHVSEIVGQALTRVAEPASEEPGSSYEERACSRCWGEGLAYDDQRGEWVACGRCEGSGRIMAFVYPRANTAGRLLAECVGCGERFPHRELVEVTEDQESLTWFVGDKLCVRECAGAHGAL